MAGGRPQRSAAAGACCTNYLDTTNATSPAVRWLLSLAPLMIGVSLPDGAIPAPASLCGSTIAAATSSSERWHCHRQAPSSSLARAPRPPSRARQQSPLLARRHESLATPAADGGATAATRQTSTCRQRPWIICRCSRYPAPGGAGVGPRWRQCQYVSDGSALPKAVDSRSHCATPALRCRPSSMAGRAALAHVSYEKRVSLAPRP